MSEAVLLRHAETEWSRTGRHTGRSDVPLTEDGRTAARALGPCLGERRFALALTSPLSRASETAGLVGLDAEVEPNLVEWDYGEYEGLTAPQIRAGRPGWSLWRDGCPGGEDPAAVGERVDRVIARLLEGLTGEGDAAIVAQRPCPARAGSALVRARPGRGCAPSALHRRAQRARLGA